MPYIYLIHCRASVNAKENVYKIGKSNDFNKRLEGYDKGSVPIFTLYVSESDRFEKILIAIFSGKFILRKDYGNEYFQGNVSAMMNTIVKTYNDSIEDHEYNCGGGINQSGCFDGFKVDVVKVRTQLRNKLNKIKLVDLDMFQKNLNTKSSELGHLHYFWVLYNSVSTYRDDKTMRQPPTPYKFGDYLETHYAFINNLCARMTHHEDGTATFRFIEHIKIC